MTDASNTELAGDPRPSPRRLSWPAAVPGQSSGRAGGCAGQSSPVARPRPDRQLRHDINFTTHENIPRKLVYVLG